MKTFTKFIYEDLQNISIENSANSNVYKNANGDIFKHSQNFVYHDLEYEVHEIMSKNSNLFVKIFENFKQNIITEELDINNFLLEYNLNKKELPLYPKTNNSLRKFRLLFDETLQDYDFAKSYKRKFENSKSEIYNLENKFCKDYIILKYEILICFEQFLNKNLKLFKNNYIFLDLHHGNFGFIKNSDKIRCFDPIGIKIDKI